MELAAGYAAAMAVGAALTKAYSWYTGPVKNDPVQAVQRSKHSIVMNEIKDCSSAVITRRGSISAPEPRPQDFLEQIVKTRSSLRKVGGPVKNPPALHPVAQAIVDRGQAMNSPTSPCSSETGWHTD